MSRQFEQQLPPSERANLPTEHPRKSSIISLSLSRTGVIRSALIRDIQERKQAAVAEQATPKSLDTLYAELLRDVQIQTHRWALENENKIFKFLMFIRFM